MSDSQELDPFSNEVFRNRMAALLHELDQPETDADLAAALDAVTARPLGDVPIQRILRQVRSSMQSEQRQLRRTADQASGRNARRSSPHLLILLACATAVVVMGLVFHQTAAVDPDAQARHTNDLKVTPRGELISSVERSHVAFNAPAVATDSTALGSKSSRFSIGDTIRTGPREKRRVTLPDGSILSMNEQSEATIVDKRRVKLVSGEVFVEVVPASMVSPDAPSDRFVVETPHRSVTALGTKFVVKAHGPSTSVVVTQGQVKVSGVDDVIPAGQELIADLTESHSAELRPARRSAHVIEWVKDLLAATGAVVIPASEHAGGSVTVVDPQGQEMKLSLRKFHVDVHIEDGFARTTIDQTYFNHTWQQLEGTFRFPLPADASLSRLAMYVNGTLMEGGMVERDYGRNVFEQIRHTRRDPALLEWVDGSTFQMRVFPLEPRQEKRILMSYTQRLASDYGKSVYRFPSGHNLDGVRHWSTHLLVKGAAGTKWYSPSHLLSGRDEGADLLIEGIDEYAALDRDLVIELGDEATPDEKVKKQAPTAASWSTFEQDGSQYVMLRQRPDLKSAPQAARRHWIFVVENSADRNEVLAATQQQIAKVLLDNVEHSDVFSIIRAGTQAESWNRRPVECSLDNVAAALEFLGEVAPIGALDLEEAFAAVRRQIRGNRDVWIVHLGTGIPVLGERDETTLLRMLPKPARYVGVAVGKRWSKSFMETAAKQTGGHVTQINPDEAVAWRSFDLLSTLNAPRLTEIALTAPTVAAGESQPEFLLLTSNLAHGQELAAVARLPKGQTLPKEVTIAGKVNGQPWSQTIGVPRIEAANSAGHLPRSWARLEIDRLVSLGAIENKARIIELSKAMYVVSPFTSLLVLETDAMYEQFKVDRGRKDHWALYPAPAQIPVTPDVSPALANSLDAAKERLQQAQARTKAAQANYDKAVADKRPAVDLKRLERIKRVEQGDVVLMEREIQRIEAANKAAADPVLQAWNSVIQRRTAWEVSYLQTPHHWGVTNLWNKLNKQSARSSQAPRFWFGSRRLSEVPAYDFDNDGDGIELELLKGLSRWDDSSLDGGSIQFPTAEVWTRYAEGRAKIRRQDGETSLSSKPRIRIMLGPEEQMLSEDEPMRQLSFDLDSVTSFAAGTVNLNAYMTTGQSLFELPVSLSGTEPLGWANWEFVENVWKEAELKQRVFAGVTDLSLEGFEANVDDLISFGRFITPELPGEPSLHRGFRGQGIQSMEGLLPTLSTFDSVPVEFRHTLMPIQFGGEYVLPNVELRSDLTFTHPYYYRAGSGIYRVNAHHPLAGVVRDLPGYAPGLQSWPADRLAVVERVAPKARQGDVDAEARHWIEKARSLGWERITLPGDKTSHPSRRGGNVVVADATGRFVLNREVGEGLRETTLSDGSTLWHLYPEIGLGAKRTVSRFHRSAIQSLIPWYVPPVDDLSLGADVKLVAPRTIRITGHVQPGEATAKSPDDARKNAAQRFAVELIFSEQGQLAESKLVNVATGQYLLKQTIGADGLVRLFGADDKLIVAAQYRREPAEAPDLVPATADLVVLPMPYRSSARSPVSVPVNLQNNTPDYSKLSDDDALLLLGTYFAEARSLELTTFIEQRFMASGDRRIGLAVLLASVNPQHSMVTGIRAQHPDSALAKFMEQFASVVAYGNLDVTMDVGEAASPFLKRVCDAYNNYARWATDKAISRDRPAADVERDLVVALQFVRDCRSLGLAAKLLATVEGGLKRNERMTAAFARKLSDAAAEIALERNLSAFARPARIDWLLTIGDDPSVADAKELLRAQFADSIASGSEVELTTETRAAFAKHYKTAEGAACGPWGEIVRDAAQKLAELKRPFTLIEMARRCVALGERALAAEIFSLAVQGQDLNAKPVLNLMALEYAREAMDWDLAATCVDRALADEKQKGNSKLWRVAADVAHQRKKYVEWMESLDHAYELEFAALPKTVNLEEFRKDYEQLFTEFDQRTEQLLEAKQVDKLAFARIVQRAASRWRDIDVDDTAACHRTAKILTRLGMVSAAWNYWTSPLAEAPDQSSAWLTFANTMNSEQRFSVADRAFDTAFSCEPTNPEILLQHAVFYRATGQEPKAREMLTRITTSQWQPRFDAIKSQAMTLLSGGLKP